MRNQKIVSIFAICFILCTFSACGLKNRGVKLVDAKIVTAVDEKLMPVKVADTFPEGTSKVSCWIQWKNAKINTQILAKWHYVTDDTHVLDYSFTIPKREGTGGVTLSMPEGKKLPLGLYQVNLFLGKRLLKSLTFRIE